MDIIYHGYAGDFLDDAFLGPSGLDVTVVQATPTVFEVLNNATGLTTVMTGTGFTYNVFTGEVTGGTMTGMEVLDGTTSIIEMSSFSWSMVAFYNALLDAANFDDYTAIDALWASQPINADASGSTTSFGGELLGSQNNSIIGSAFADSFMTGAGNDTMNGGNGNDTLIGGAGNDSLRGEADNDWIEGGEGNDRLFGSGGNDTILGGNGIDRIFDGSGNDSVEAGDGIDIVVSGRGRDYIDLGNGNDRFFDDTQTGAAGSDTVLGGDGVDRIYGKGGDDSLDGGLSRDYIQGGVGNDELFGGDGKDDLDGGDDHDFLDGGRGHDVLIGGSGNDELNGGRQNDWLDGGTGDDTLIAGSGRDTVTGGTGADVFVFSTINGTASVMDFTIVDDTLELDDALWTGTKTAAQVIADHSSYIPDVELGDYIRLSFADGTQINLLGVSSTVGLEATIVIF